MPISQKQTPINSAKGVLDKQKLMRLSKLYDSHNHVINKESIGVSKALHNAQKMLAC